jgi:hypothetical protein
VINPINVHKDGPVKDELGLAFAAADDEELSRYNHIAIGADATHQQLIRLAASPECLRSCGNVAPTFACRKLQPMPISRQPNPNLNEHRSQTISRYPPVQQLQLQIRQSG